MIPALMRNLAGRFVRIAASMLIAALCGLLILPAVALGAVDSTTEQPTDSITQPSAEKLYQNLQIELQALASVVMDTGRQRILYEDDSDQTMPIPAASKLMTFLIACERLALDTMVTISSVAADQPDALNSRDDVDLKTGDKYPLEYLLLRLLYLNSDAAAVAIAEQTSNEEEKFVELMNSRAEAFGMTRTVFKNSTGRPVYIASENSDSTANPVQVPAQYSTALDMARLVQAGLQNQTFSRLFSQSSEFLVLDGQRIVSMRNEIEAIWTLSEGAVTGAFYSESDGQATVVTVGTSEGISWITVAASTTVANRFSDTLELYRRCSEYYMLSPLVQSGDMYAENIEQTIDGERFGLVYRNTVYYIHPVDDDFLRPTVRYRTYGPHSRPIQRSMIVGQVLFELRDNTVIAVDVGPDRQILSTITVVDRALEQLQGNPNLTLLIFVMLLILVLSLIWQVYRGTYEMIHLLILVRLGHKSKRK